jgi:TonB family protein
VVSPNSELRAPDSLKERSKSLALTLLIHGILFLILLFTFMHTQIPPFGGGGGSQSNLGLIEIAYGDVQPVSENQKIEPVPVQLTLQEKVKEEEIATQDVEEAPPVVEKKEIKKPEKKTPVKITTPPLKTKPKEPVKPAQKVDPIALYKGKSNNAASQGNSQTGKGDQGNPNGDPNALYTGKNGTGTGPGSGTGSGGGNGSGTGPGNGAGISFDLGGRTSVALSKPNDNSQETGKVVVNITVDKYGTVTNANPGGRGSTTTSANLYRKAKEAALKAKFSPCTKETCAEEQHGTITFVFLVQ